MLSEIQTKTVDVNTWNALIFIVTSLITVLLSVIAWYQKKNSDDQHELVKQVTMLAKDTAVIKANSDNMQKTVDKIEDNVEGLRDDVEGLRKDYNDHEKRIYKLEAIK